VELPRFLGVDLPRGVRVGFNLTAEQLELKDEQDDTLLRAPREAVDPTWIDAALRLQGTMLVASRHLELDPDESPACSWPIGSRSAPAPGPPSAPSSASSRNGRPCR
jgi:hypothetical protein